MFVMNFDPTKFFYTINPASCKSGVDVVLVRLETQETKVIYMAVHTPTSEGLRAQLDSLTDDLFLDFFVKGKEARKLEKERQAKAKAEQDSIFKASAADLKAQALGYESEAHQLQEMNGLSF